MNNKRKICLYFGFNLTIDKAGDQCKIYLPYKQIQKFNIPAKNIRLAFSENKSFIKYVTT